MEELTSFAGLSCDAFTEVLASKTPVPGGGGVSALVGALGVALCTMAGNHTTGKKKYAEYEEDLQQMIFRGEAIRRDLLLMIDADAEAFAPLQQAYSIPKDDPSRAQVLEDASIAACIPAISMMRLIAESIELLEEMLVKGSVMMVSDVGCGAYFASAALQSASLNIFINVKGLDAEPAKRLYEEAKELLDEYVPRADAVAKQVMEKLS